MKMSDNTPIIIQGLTVSKGIILGQCKLLQHGQSDYRKEKINSNQVPRELKRLDSTKRKSLVELKKIKNKLKPNVRKNIGMFLDTHIMLINDKNFTRNVKKNIKDKLLCADWAIYEEYLSIKSSFDGMRDLYIKQRIEDINHIVKLLLKNLKKNQKSVGTGLSSLGGFIVVTDDLSPADVLVAHQTKCVALISEFGGRSSHSSILSRGLEIPSIVGVKNALSTLKNDDEVILDGNHGIIIINPDQEAKRYYRRLQRDDISKKKKLSLIMNKDCFSSDNQRIEIMANLELPQEMKILTKKKFDGIGLFRTEYLYTDRTDFPTEAEQVAGYKKIVQKMRDKPVVFRTLDIGADKEIPENIKSGSIARNPALGLRGIRYSLNNQKIFLNQVKAILRAGYYGNVKIMLPMITTLSEIIHAKNLIELAKEHLRKRKLKFSNSVDVGIMVEVPSCAVLSSKFAEHVDFLSIGTNDLVQYTLAIDRVDDEVNYLYDPYNNAVLNLIKNVIESGIKQKIQVSLCGEMAGDIQFTRLLLGMGLKSFSMHPSAIPEVKEIILKTDIRSLEKLSSRIINCVDSKEKHELIKKLNQMTKR
tara:strand:- start:1154 stop:2917 length:1764 start_codon:yes stop_codon:yes gene_type:complete